MKTLKSPNLKHKVKSISTSPGIYQYFDTNDQIIYVGKAKNLRNRVRSYFAVNLEPNSKTAVLVSQIRKIVYIETLSELEALILEAALIKKHQPKYNIALKDDKSYLYIVIRPEHFEIDGHKISIPKVLAARETDLKKTDITFGPYPHGNKAKDILRSLRKIIPYRDCSTSKFKKHQKLNSPCLYGHIGLCQAPCTDKVSPERYKKEIRKIKSLLAGDSSAFLKSIEKEMKKASKAQNFEEAAYYRDILSKFRYIRQKFSRAQQYIDNPYLVEDLREKSLTQIKDTLPFLEDLPERIECYDISNISGTDAVGSMVVALNGEVSKQEYRRFKIKTKNSPDDFAMMAEVLTRRLKKDWAVPDLLVLDGGKGQLSAVQKVLNKLNLDTPMIGLAKKFETIVYIDPETLNFVEINLPRDSEGLKLLQRLRDEAHRFAQAYHHKLRLNQLKLPR